MGQRLRSIAKATILALFSANPAISDDGAASLLSETVKTWKQAGTLAKEGADNLIERWEGLLQLVELIQRIRQGHPDADLGPISPNKVRDALDSASKALDRCGPCLRELLLADARAWEPDEAKVAALGCVAAPAPDAALWDEALATALGIADPEDRHLALNHLADSQASAGLLE